MNDRPGKADSFIDRTNILIGHITSWLTLAMVLIAVVIVVMRYIFDSGLIWLQESLTWMHAAVFMFGAAYTMQQEEHVRVDIFYRNLSERQRGWVNLCGVCLFIVPMCGFFVWTSMTYVSASWIIKETSRNAGGLPYPFIPLLKSTLLIMPLMVALQGLSLALRSVQKIRVS